MADVPHFAYPFRFRRGAAAVNEQDSAEDVRDCVLAALLTHPGDREERPEYGSADLTFAQLPVDGQAIVETAGQWEPRAVLLLDEDDSYLESAVAVVSILETEVTNA